MPALTFATDCRPVRILTQLPTLALLAALSGCGGSSSGGTPVSPPVLSTLAYSAWSLAVTAPTPVGVVPAADTSSATRTKALQAYNALLAYWSAAPSGARVRTFWFVPTMTPVDGQNTAAGLYLSDSLPGSAGNGANPLLRPFATPAAQTAVYDDAQLNWSWNVTGTAPLNASITAQFETMYPGSFAIFACLGQDVAPYVYQRVTFNGAGTTATGTITYNFRTFQNSCLRPRAVSNTWSLSIPFTATRVR